MAILCPAPGPGEPLVRSLLGVVDCNVQGLVRGGYATFFEPSSTFSIVLTSLLTVYVAIVGYRMLLGRGQLRVGELAVNAVKIGVVLALTTQWASYQTVVYDFLFRGPEELAGAMLGGVQPQGSLFRGDVFDGLQAVFDALNAYAKAFGQGLTGQPAPGVSGPGFAPQALTMCALTILLASLGVLLAMKIILGLLLAVGPLFIALMLFESTRGLFEGWLRASIACALAPLATIVLLGVELTVLEPSLLRLRDQVAQGDFSLNVVYSVLVLVIVFAAVSAGMLVAGAIVAVGLKLPRPGDDRAPIEAGGGRIEGLAVAAAPSRAARIAAAAVALERRETATFSRAGADGDRRTVMTFNERGAGAARGPVGHAAIPRLGQGPRRGAGPRAGRGGARSGR